MPAAYEPPLRHRMLLELGDRCFRAVHGTITLHTTGWAFNSVNSQTGIVPECLSSEWWERLHDRLVLPPKDWELAVILGGGRMYPLQRPLGEALWQESQYVPFAPEQYQVVPAGEWANRQLGLALETRRLTGLFDLPQDQGCRWVGLEPYPLQLWHQLMRSDEEDACGFACVADLEGLHVAAVLKAGSSVAAWKPYWRYRPWETGEVDSSRTATAVAFLRECFVDAERALGPIQDQGIWCLKLEPGVTEIADELGLVVQFPTAPSALPDEIAAFAHFPLDPFWAPPNGSAEALSWLSDATRGLRYTAEDWAAVCRMAWSAGVLAVRNARMEMR